jgi:hypothetical protein
MQSHCQVPGHGLQVVIRTCFTSLGAEVDFAEQGLAEEDQDAIIDALECDGVRQGRG